MNAISFTTSTPHSVVHLYHLNSCLVLARIEFHHNVGIGSVSFLFNEIVSCVLFHLLPFITNKQTCKAKMTVGVRVKTSTSE